jgi:hypothetical protein
MNNARFDLTNGGYMELYIENLEQFYIYFDFITKMYGEIKSIVVR